MSERTNLPENAHLHVRLENDEDVIRIVLDGVVAVGAEIKGSGADGTAVPGSGDGDLGEEIGKEDDA